MPLFTPSILSLHTSFHTSRSHLSMHTSPCTPLHAHLSTHISHTHLSQVPHPAFKNWIHSHLSIHTSIHTSISTSIHPCTPLRYPAFKNWIHSHRDMPLQLNQWCNVVRWQLV